MKSTALALYLILSLLISCKKDKETTPECIQSRTIAFSNNGSCEHGANVKQYTFQGKSVFTFEMGNCGADLAVTVLDANCSTLGYLGGREGVTKINGEEFSSATYVRTIWSRP